MNRYLTKSRFVLSLECPTKLYYAHKPNEYPDQKKVDSFLFELAKGGLQVGELAKFYFADNPNDPNITVLAEPHEYDKAIAETNKRLEMPGRVIIAEGAFLDSNCYVRADIVVKTESGDIELYEVKSKSYREGEDKFIIGERLSSGWSPFLHDVAFQKWVIANSTKRSVKAHLMVIDKEAYTTVAGVAKYFRVQKSENDRPLVTVDPNVRREDLGNQLLTIIPVDAECEIIYKQNLDLSSDRIFSFEEGIAYLSSAYEKNVRLLSKPSTTCSKCEFYATPDEEKQNLRSGKKECWVGNGWVARSAFEEEALALELWNGLAGGNTPVQKLIELKKYLLKDAVRSDFEKENKPSTDGLSSHDRRELQIKKSKEGDFSPYVDTAGLSRTFANFNYPLHFIDFETSTSPIPWFSGMRPYQGIAFQFSHHIIERDDRIRHHNQYISFEPGVFPNFDFVRELMKSLGSEGTIFRYHIHENSYLNFIHDELVKSEVHDKDQLLAFIRTITEWKGPKKERLSGPRNMVDLHQIVLKYFYSLYARGSNSLKDILPAAIKSFPILREKYSRPIYGKGLEISSLNFTDKTWISETHQHDPYKTLPAVFQGYPTEKLDRLVQDTDIIADGGSAMMAYNMLQYSEIPKDQRSQIKEALLKYCELDSLAMVMLYEGLKSNL